MKPIPALCPFTATSTQTLRLLALASALALAGAYTAQYGFGLLPCELCLWQRPAFYAVAALGTLSLLLRRWKLCPGLMLILAIAILLGNAALAGYHAGVEFGWWPGPSQCSGDSENFGDLEALRAHILHAPLIRCDQPAWQFHGLTMANLNMLYCLVLAGWGAVTASRRRCLPAISCNAGNHGDKA